ncbi:MAG: hypothetical protein JNK05_15885 [Myxococcales bacterium]|nr:hypothetical protein [Myxococcales bacterium]
MRSLFLVDDSENHPSLSLGPAPVLSAVDTTNRLWYRGSAGNGGSTFLTDPPLSFTREAVSEFVQYPVNGPISHFDATATSGDGAAFLIGDRVFIVGAHGGDPPASPMVRFVYERTPRLLGEIPGAVEVHHGYYFGIVATRDGRFYGWGDVNSPPGLSLMPLAVPED